MAALEGLCPKDFASSNCFLTVGMSVGDNLPLHDLKAPPAPS